MLIRTFVPSSVVTTPWRSGHHTPSSRLRAWFAHRNAPLSFGAGHSALDFSEPFEVFPAVELQPYGFANVLHLDIEEVFEPHAIPRSGQLRFGHLTLHAGEGRSLTDAQVREPSGGTRKMPRTLK